MGIDSSDIGLWREIGRDAWRFGVVEAKNLVKAVLGRPPYRGDMHRRRGRLLGLLLRGRRIRAVTCTDFHDHEGAGSRALMTMYAMAFCRETGVAYYHTPMKNLRHADRDQAEWDAAWEAFFRLGEGETPATESPVPVFDLYELTTRVTAGGGDLAMLLRPRPSLPRPAYYLEYCYLEDDAERVRAADHFVATLGAMVPEFRRRFRTGTPRRSNPVPIVAVHIRRGDVQRDTPFMWTELDAFAVAIDQVRAVMRSLGLAFEVHVHSQGDLAALAPLEGEGVRLFADEDPFWTLRELIEADVLVMSKSCFSYVAALLGDGIAIFEDCRLPPFPDWLVRTGEGTIDTKQLRQLLEARVA